MKPSKTQRAAAYHEAGHAVADFLSGRSHIVHVCMKRNGESAAHVRSAYRMDRTLVLGLGNSGNEGLPHDWERRAAYREILNSLAGPAAEHRVSDPVDDPLNGDWLFALSDDASSYEAGADLHAAEEMATIVGRTDRRAWRIVRMVAKWADELMAIPRVWGTVTALASNLKHGVTMSGEDACRIMRQAWGNDDGLPICSLGRKWTRRFMTSTKGR